MKVWILQTEWASNYEQGGDCTAYANYDLAKEAFDKEVQNDKEIYEGLGYEQEEAEDQWSTWEDGSYASNHSNINLVERPVEGAE